MTEDAPEIPDDLLALMAKIGPTWETDRTQKIAIMAERFSAVLKNQPKQGVMVRRNLIYGTHPRQAFDIYLPDDVRTHRAVVLFVHGGAFLDGHRNRTEEIYSNVGWYFGRHGVATINVGYRLGNDTRYPGATDDIATMVQWTHDHAEELGVDSDRIFLMGHSAGAAHAGSYAYDRRRHPPRGPGLAGLIVVSGRVRADNRPENPNAARVVGYYGTDDPQALDDVSPVSHVTARSVPTLVAWGEYENPLLDVHCSELVFRLAVAKKRSPPVVWLRGHNHTSTITHINTAEDRLGRAMLDFIRNPL